LTLKTQKQKSEIALTARERRVLMAIDADPEARKDFYFISRKIGCTAEKLIIDFVVEAWGPKPDADEAEAVMNRRNLESFASRIKNLAVKMRSINDLSYWNFSFPRAGLIAGDQTYLEKQFRELPELLSLYARNVELKVISDRTFDKDHPDSRGKAAEFEFSEALCMWLKQKTGRRYRDRVASIQRVTYHLAGRRAPASGETLRKREARRKKVPQ
jgi:hypothetical protein